MRSNQQTLSFKNDSMNYLRQKEANGDQKYRGLNSVRRIVNLSLKFRE